MADHCPTCGSQLSNVGFGTCNNIHTRDFWHDEKEFRRVLDAYHSRQATQYIEMLRNLSRDRRPQAGLDLVADYIEWLAVTGAETDES